MNPIRTIIIDDERNACDRLKRLLSSFPHIQVLDSITNSRQGLDAILRLKPDLVFLDIELENNVSAFDILQQLAENFFRPCIILVTAFPHYSIKAIKNEVFDYILKPVDIDELKVTINRFMDHLSLKNTRFLKELNMLSERESQVLRYVLEGKNSREIADLLFISLNTVHTHRRNILKKTGVSSLVELLRINFNLHDQREIQ
jgi:DNA-binding NarL/FixJ family response regulator